MTGDCHVPFRGSPGVNSPGRPDLASTGVTMPVTSRR